MDLATLHRFHIAPGYDPALPATWVWTDRSQDVNHPEGEGAAAVRITGGRGDEVGEVEAGSAILEVDNAGGHYCDDNPYGRWFGLLAQGCPARWGTISGAESWTTNTSNGWGTPDVGASWSLEGSASNWSSSGGVGLWASTAPSTAGAAELVESNARNGEATVVFTCPVVATGGSLFFSVLARRSGPSSTLLFACEFGISGALTARIRRDNGGLVNLAQASAGTYSAGQRIKMRCQWDGQDLRMRAWPEASAEPTTWTVTATDDQCTGSLVGVHGFRTGANTNAGTVSFSFDDLEIEAVEIVGTLPDLPTRWDSTATVSWSPLEIAGITRRITQGEELVESPIHRQLSSNPVAAYWSLEDEGGASVAASSVARGLPATITGGTLGSSDCPAGAISALTLTTGGSSQITGLVRSWPVPQNGYAVMAYFRQPSLSASSSPIDSNRLFSIAAVGTVTRWTVYATSTGFFIKGALADGTLQVDLGSFAFTNTDPTRWYAIQLEAQEVGGNVEWALTHHQVGGTTFTTTGTLSFAGTADRITSATAYAPVDGTLVSHLWCGDDLLPFVDQTFRAVSAAYPGETDTARIARVFREAGIPIAVEPGAGEPLGPQPVTTTLDVARDAEKAGMGVLYETGAGYGYRPRSARYNRAVDMSLAMAATGDIADAPEPAKPDLHTRNFWKVTRTNGSSATDQDAAHIAKNGRRPDTATVNVQADGVLLDQASWRVHLGTWGEYRWPQLVVDLTDRPSLLAAWRGRPFGARITVTGVPSQGPVGQDLSLIVEGFTQEITSHGWRVTLNCSPARPWDVAVYGTSRYGSASTTTGSTLPASTGTGVSLTLTYATPKDGWSTTATGYQILARGEVMTVTGMGAPSGTAPTISQVATVTRAVNGIVVAHAIGEPVQTYPAPRYAL